MAIKRNKISGAFGGNLWLPQGATAKAKEKAAQYKNGIEEQRSVIGRFEQVEAFGDDEPHFAITERYKEENDDLVRVDAPALMVPDHGQLLKALKNAPAGAMVEIVYKGSEEIQDGKWKGRQAHLYDVSELILDGAPF